MEGRPAEATLESWIHVEIDRVTDAAELSHIEEALRRVPGENPLLTGMLTGIGLTRNGVDIRRRLRATIT